MTQQARCPTCNTTMWFGTDGAGRLLSECPHCTWGQPPPPPPPASVPDEGGHVGDLMEFQWCHERTLIRKSPNTKYHPRCRAKKRRATPKTRPIPLCDVCSVSLPIVRPWNMVRCRPCAVVARKLTRREQWPASMERRRRNLARKAGREAQQRAQYTDPVLIAARRAKAVARQPSEQVKSRDRYYRMREATA